MKINKTLVKNIIKSIFLNDNLFSVVGVVVGVVDGLIRYFCGQTDKAIFWILVALVCLMNLKETPK